jgi:2-phospho-L-lactate guanylyltransferase
MPHRYVVLVPIKTGPATKTRLDAGDLRVPVMHAFARDAIAALQASEDVSTVLVVSRDDLDLGQDGWLPDAGGGLNAALSSAADAAHNTHPRDGIVAMLGDLPCLTPTDVDVVLAFGQGHSRWFLADHHQTGTTMLGVSPGQPLNPLFGPNSAVKHADSGAVACDLPAASARIDIDTTADLQAAIRFGVGENTAKALRAGDFRQPTLNE